MSEQVDDAGAVGEAEHLPHVVGAHDARGMRDRLVEQRQRIAHRAFGGARDHAERLRLDLDVFLRRDVAEMAHQHVGLDAAQVEALAARQHRHRHLADFGGGEHELGVRRRLLQRLQEGVEGRVRQHVDFVDDVDLVARAGRRVAHASLICRTSSTPVWEAASISSTSMCRPSMIAWQCTPSPGMSMVGPFTEPSGHLVVQRAGEDARRRGLADAAHAGEDPGLRNAPGLERVRQRAHHRVLADQIVEMLRAIFARQHAVGLGRSRDRAAAAPSAKPGWSAAGSVGGVAGWPASVIDRSAEGLVSEPVCGNALALSGSRLQAFPVPRLDRWGTVRVEACKPPSIDGALNSLEKTGRRLTSDPIRTSLGLLPSGPDPVGEWLVHRQSPAAYLEPNATECKRGGGACGRAKARADPASWDR